MRVRAPLVYPDWPLHRFVQNVADRTPERVVVRHDDAEMSFGTLDALGNTLAGALGRVGVGVHDRVMMLSANRPEWLVCQHGVSLAGAASVLGNASWKPAEVDHAVSVTTPTAIIADTAGAEAIDRSTSNASVRVCLDADAPDGWTPLGEFMADISDARGPELVADPANQEAVLPFSSGTTGMPKAVRHSHRGMVAGTLQRVDAYALGPDDRLQFFMPLFTIFGVIVSTCTYATGSSLRLFRRFDPVEALENVASDSITVGFGTLPVAARYVDLDDLERFDLSSLRYLLWGATPLSPEITGTFAARTGVRWLGAYSTTEVGITSNDARHPERTYPDSPGYAMADTDIRVVDPGTGRELTGGEEGEIQVRSPSLMLGYVGGDEPITDDGYFRTGDIGTVDADGMVRITERLKDLVKVSGFSVAPAEVERALLQHPDIVDCAVYGMPDPARGEVLEAAVVTRRRIDPDEVRRFLDDLLARYKRPTTIRFVDVVPRNAAGKTLRRVLRDEASRRSA